MTDAIAASIANVEAREEQRVFDALVLGEVREGLGRWWDSVFGALPTEPHVHTQYETAHVIEWMVAGEDSRVIRCLAAVLGRKTLPWAMAQMMEDTIIEVDRPVGLPPRWEFEDAMAWLGALPPGTLMRITEGQGIFRSIRLVPVEYVIDGLAMAPILHAHLEAVMRDLDTGLA